MEKNMKRILNILFAVVLSFAFALTVLPSALMHKEPLVTASAEDVTDSNANKAGLTDKNSLFYFNEGAAIHRSDYWASSIDGLGFQLCLQDVERACPVDDNGESMVSIFTLYRVNSILSNAPIPVYQIIVWTNTTFAEKGAITMFMHKALNTDDGVDVYNPSNVFLEQRPTSSCSKVLDSKSSGIDLMNFNNLKELMQESGYGVLDYIACYDSFNNVEHLRFMKDGNSNIPSVRLGAILDSPNAEYYVDYEYGFQEYTHTTTNFWQEKTRHYKTTQGRISSSTRSMFKVLNNMYEIGGEDLLKNELGPSFDHGFATLKNNYVEGIKVRYLEQIADLPFARMVTRRISVPVLTFGQDRKIYHDDVCNALDVSTLSLMGSNWSGFKSVYDEGEEVWQATYFEAVYLVSRTTDGNTTDAGSQSSTKYFLDLNKSYYDYYHSFVENGVFTQDVYEYYFNDLVNACSSLQGIQPEELYGYWGFVGIPRTNSVNTLWAEMFDVDTSTAGIFKSFDYDATITYEAYNTLLTEYKYRWWEKAWNNVSNFVTGSSAEASIYFFCADPNVEFVGILENGATDLDDADGVLKNEVDGVVTEILEGLPSLVEDTQAKIENAIKTVVGVVCGVALVAGGIYLFTVLNKKKQ